jgi:glutaredoxin-like protein NrdH
MQITVYTNTNCVQCEQTKIWLNKHNIDFDTKMLADSPEIQPLIEERGFASAPIVTAGNLAWSGFRIDKLKTLVALIHGEKK